MRILAIADEPSKALWDYYEPSRLEGIDLILSCGDLPAAYLSFLVTFAHCPVLYVHGNHDDRYEKDPPEGCICVEDTVYNYNGVRILGLGGSMRYSQGIHQYSEKEMKRRIRKLRFRIWRSHGYDILLTHAPLRGVNDLDDLPHRGFACFKDLIQKYHPKFMVHGHVHMNYSYRLARCIDYKGTVVLNAFERHVFDYPSASSDQRS